MNRILRFVSICAVLLAMTIAFDGPASAVSGPGANGSCNQGDFCGWNNHGAGGGIFDTPYAVNGYSSYSYWGSVLGVADSVSSVRNEFVGSPVELYRDGGYQVGLHCFPKQMVAHQDLISSDNQASSHKGVSSC